MNWAFMVCDALGQELMASGSVTAAAVCPWPAAGPAPPGPWPIHCSCATWAGKRDGHRESMGEPVCVFHRLNAKPAG